MNSTTHLPALVLASTSPFRRELLQRLGVPFETVSPDIDESPLPGEPAQQLVRRLAELKARAVAGARQALIIGSDQVASSGTGVLGKPGGHAHAMQQLRRLSGKRVSFYTGLCLLDSRSGHIQVDMVPFHVQFRRLTDDQIERYLHADQPYHCAGSFKSEGLGITLFESLEGSDPTALIGLPLIRLTAMLGNAGIVLP